MVKKRILSLSLGKDPGGLPMAGDVFGAKRRPAHALVPEDRVAGQEPTGPAEDLARLRRCYWALFWAYLAEIPMRAFTLVAMPLYFPAYLLPGLAYTIILARLAQWDWRYERAWGMSYVCCAMRCLVEMCAYTHLPMSRVSAALLFTLSAFVISAPAPCVTWVEAFAHEKVLDPWVPDSALRWRGMIPWMSLASPCIAAGAFLTVYTARIAPMLFYIAALLFWQIKKLICLFRCARSLGRLLTGPPSPQSAAPAP